MLSDMRSSGDKPGEHTPSQWPSRRRLMISRFDLRRAICGSSVHPGHCSRVGRYGHCKPEARQNAKAIVEGGIFDTGASRVFQKSGRRILDDKHSKDHAMFVRVESNFTERGRGTGSWWV